MKQVEEMSLVLTHLSQHCFDKCLELIEKERENVKPGPYRSLLNQLPNLTNAERSYCNLGFVTTKNKIFLRKDNSLRSMYDGLKTELSRLDESFAGFDVALISSQIYQHVNSRIQLIEIYEKMYGMGIHNKMMKYEELLSMLEEVMANHSILMNHPAFTTLKSAVCIECEVLILLLKAQIDIQNWRFLSSLLNLHSANSRLSVWEKTLQNRETWKLGFGASFLKANPLPPLVQWLVKLKVATLHKCTLYFHHTLLQQTSAIDFKAICSKHGIDSFHKLQSMQRRHNAMTVMLLYEPHDSGPASKSLPHTVKHNIIVYTPIKLLEQLPTISKAIIERAADLAAVDRVVFCYSIKDQCSYFMTNLDPKITLVFVFDSKKDEKETSLCKSIMELSSQIRNNNNIFTKLKLNA